MMSGKVLIILSDAHSFPIHNSDGSTIQEQAGFSLTELAKPLGQLLDAGYDVTFASPDGKSPNVDPLSQSLLTYFGNWWAKNKENDSLVNKLEVENDLKSPRPFTSITDAELESFSGVFVPGGHAPISDLGHDSELGRILLHFQNEHKPAAALCHGPFALMSTIECAPNFESPGFAQNGCKLTSWSDAEERLVEKMKGGEVLPRVESTRDAEGAGMTSNTSKKMGGISVDREVISGANPIAVNALGTQFIEMLRTH